MRDLVREFGGEPPDLDTGALLSWLNEFSADHWDFRRKTGQNVERDQVEMPVFSEPTAALIQAVAASLGLVESLPPPRGAYDHLLVLGGLARACLQRTSHAARLLGTGTEVGHVAALGSFRPLGSHEVDLLERMGAAGCGYEVDAMDVGIRSAFEYAQPQQEQSSDGETTTLSWLVRTYRSAGQPRVDVLAAPSTDPATRRANTPDTYDFWARQVTLSPDDWVLVVTSPIYIPFQHSDAIRMLGLPYGCGVHTVGFDLSRATEPLLRQTIDPDRYLQEIRSGIRSMWHLHQALTQPATV